MSDFDENDFFDDCTLESYSSAGSGNHPLELSLEDKYYNAKGLLPEDSEKAIQDFKDIIQEEGNQSLFSFKSTKQILKYYLRKKNYEEVKKLYQELLDWPKGLINGTHYEKSIDNMINRLHKINDSNIAKYAVETTLKHADEVENKKLQAKLNLMIANELLLKKDWFKLEKHIETIRDDFQVPENCEDFRKNNNLLELYALEIQLYTELNKSNKLKQLYDASQKVNTAIPHPRIQGVIKECGGKMYLRERKYEQAYGDFFESFKNFSDSGSVKKIQVLKYLVLSSMLSELLVDPFDSPEITSYRNHSEIKDLCNLVNAYQKNDCKKFEAILKENKDLILSDSLFKGFFNELTHNVRVKSLSILVKPYSKLKLSFIEQKLNISKEDLMETIMTAILDRIVKGEIDQLNEVLVMPLNIQTKKRARQVTNLIDNISNLKKKVCKRLE